MRFEYTREGITFVWEGGSYIEMFWEDAYRLRGADHDEPAPPFTVANVRDHSAPMGEVSIPRTEEAFRAKCDEWLEENRDDLNKHLENSA